MHESHRGPVSKEPSTQVTVMLTARCGFDSRVQGRGVEGGGGAMLTTGAPQPFARCLQGLEAV